MDLRHFAFTLTLHFLSHIGLFAAASTICYKIVKTLWIFTYHQLLQFSYLYFHFTWLVIVSLLNSVFHFHFSIHNFTFIFSFSNLKKKTLNGVLFCVFPMCVGVCNAECFSLTKLASRRYSNWLHHFVFL